MSNWATATRRISRANQRFGIYTPRIDEFCFLIGAMKSGTTTLYQYLAQHPQIAPNQHQKEPEFFSGGEMPKNVSAFFRQYMPKPFSKQVALDGSTGCTKRPAFPDVARRLATLPGQKHFIYLVRHPVDRLESHLAHNLAAGGTRLGFGDALPDVDHYLAVSSYAFQLDAYRAAFPEIAVKIVDFKALTSDPLRLLGDICHHIGIDQNFSFTKLTPQNTRSTRSDIKTFRLTDTQRDEFTERLRPDVLRLRDEYGFDVSPWGIA